jgi:hypothetical protein
VRSPRNAIICGTGTFKKGDPPPDGYMDWHAWAEVQYKAGLRQNRCRCGKWLFPQENEVSDVRRDER